MRTITTHQVAENSSADRLDIWVQDEAGAGNAHHVYGIYGFWTRNNRSATLQNQDETCLQILFQNGPVTESLNGVTNEALLAIVIDRLESFQKGDYGCDENDWALSYCKSALAALHNRTRDRISRNVEGTYKK